MNIIVTGANGFIGTHLCRKMVDDGHQVYAIIQKGTPENIEASNISYIYCDMSQYDELPSMLSNVEIEAFYHYAWAGTSGPSRGDYKVQLLNCEATCDAVKAAKEIGAKRFIVSCTINEYETVDYFQKSGITPGPGYIYGTGKIAAHYMGQVVAQQNDIDFIPVIVTNIYGPGEISARLVNTSIKKYLEKKVPDYTEGKQTYDFIYIDDAIDIFALLATKGRKNQIYYLGSGKPKPLRNFLEVINNVVDPSVDSNYGAIPFQGANIDYDQFDLGGVRRELGYNDFTSFEEGIRRTMMWIKDN